MACQRTATESQKGDACHVMILARTPGCWKIFAAGSALTPVKEAAAVLVFTANFLLGAGDQLLVTAAPALP